MLSNGGVGVLSNCMSIAHSFSNSFADIDILYTILMFTYLYPLFVDLCWSTKQKQIAEGREPVSLSGFPWQYSFMATIVYQGC